jgi:hypothetical protein
MFAPRYTSCQAAAKRLISRCDSQFAVKDATTASWGRVGEKFRAHTCSSFSLFPLFQSFSLRTVLQLQTEPDLRIYSRGPW